MFYASFHCITEHVHVVTFDRVDWWSDYSAIKIDYINSLCASPLEILKSFLFHPKSVKVP